MFLNKADRHIIGILEDIRPRGKRKKKKSESLTDSVLPQLTRGAKKTSFQSIREAGEIASDIPTEKGNAPGAFEGPRVKVILISEGLGNRKDMNYYGPEAISSGPMAFEGKPCFLDHPGYTEEKDRPERTVRDQCGYFKNVHVETTQGKTCLVGELHFDLSESGRLAFEKALTALHYREDVQNSDQEYVGLSIAASGDWEPRKMAVEGKEEDVHYVKAFTDATSCDIVTRPARGGKFLALVESAAGVLSKEKEVGPMLKKKLQAALTAVQEAEKEPDEAKRKKSLAEANRKLSEAIKAVNEASKQNEDGDNADGDGSGDGDSHTTVTHKVVKKTGKAAVDQDKDDSEDEDEDEDESEATPDKKDEAYQDEAKSCEDEDEEESSVGGKNRAVQKNSDREAERIALTSLIKAKKLENHVDLNDLMRMPFKEARREIVRLSRVRKATLAEALALVGDQMGPGFSAKLTESDGATADNDSLFAGCMRS